MKILITDIFLRKTFDVVNILFQHHDKKNVLLLTDKLGVFNKLKCKLCYQSSNLFLLRKDEHFNSDLNRIIKKFPNDKLIYLPIEENTTLKFYNYLSAKNKHKNLVFLLPEENAFECATNKERLNMFCEKNKIACPKFISVNAFEKGDFELPIIVKPKKGSGSKGIIYINTEDALKEQNLDFESNFIQERLPESKNVEGGFYLCKKGEILSFYSHKRIRAFPESGGVTVFSKATQNEKIMQAGKKIIKALNWNGIIMIEFILDKRDNRYKVIEINPRIWGSILLSEFCGANFLKKYIDVCAGKAKLENKVLSECSIRWIFPYDIFYFFKTLSNPFNYFRSHENCCHINFTYSSFFRSVIFIFLNYFNSSKLIRLFKK